MGAVTFGIPKKLVLLLKEHFSIEVFVETGTFKGKTSIWASGIFKDVYTLENSKELFVSTSKSLIKYSNIHPLYGNSALQLNNIVSEIKQPAIFWLDAHWCGGNTYGNDAPCPLLDEIRIIKQSGYDHIIMIDDARFFLKPPPRPQNSDLWPGLKEILDLLNRDKNYFTFVSEDVMAALPETGKKALQPYFDEIHKTEFPGGGILSNILFASRNVLRKWEK
jgi:hypothetical protein